MRRSQKASQRTTAALTTRLFTVDGCELHGSDLVDDVLSESNAFFLNQHGRNSFPGGGTVNFKYHKGRSDQMVKERETRKMRETMLPSLRSQTSMCALTPSG